QSANVSFIEQLVASRRMSALEVAEFASATFGMPLFDLAAADPARFPAGVVDGKLVQTRRVLPLNRRGNRLFVAISDPSTTHTLDDIKFQSGLAIEPVVVEDDKLAATIKKFVESTDTSLRAMIDEDLELEFSHEEDETGNEDEHSEADDAPVVKF